MEPYELFQVLFPFLLSFFFLNNIIGTIFFFLGISQIILFFSLTIIFEYKRKRRLPLLQNPRLPKVSVITAAYNEENVIERCVKSICASDYENIQVMIVDDGSTDATPKILERLAESHVITVIHQKNQGKAAALNNAIEQAEGKIIVVVDADTYVEPKAVKKLVEAFYDKKVGAVCGYDRPANPTNWLVKLLVLSAHSSTGFVRRALSVINCLPVVNFGAFRKKVLQETGPFISILGEDLEITLRIHKLGYKIAFEPEAVAYSESPSSLRILWHQRIRWLRGYLQSIRIHKGMLMHNTFGTYLAFNFMSNVILPWVLLAAFPLFFLQINNWSLYLVYNLVSFFGLVPAFLVVCYSLFLDHNLRKYLRYFTVFPLWIIYSLFLDLVCIIATTQEIGGAPRKWNHWKKTGVMRIPN